MKSTKVTNAQKKFTWIPDINNSILPRQENKNTYTLEFISNFKNKTKGTSDVLSEEKENKEENLSSDKMKM